MQSKITHSLGLIQQAIQQHDQRIGLACSFGKDSIVTLHLARRINPNIQVFCITTPYWFNETHKYKDYISKKWRLHLRTYNAPLVTNESGKKNLYETDVEKCCTYYKVEPTKQAIKDLGLKAWISGLRNTEGHTREFLEEVEERNGLIKINPILNWTEADVWLYHSLNYIPPHPLYGEGYRSLGCKPCSKPYTKEERGGRWQGTKKECGECGIHTQDLVKREEDGSIKKDIYGVPKRDEGKF